MGLEPTTSRATIWRSTTELYPPQPACVCRNGILRLRTAISQIARARRTSSDPISARLEGLEPPTHGLEGRCSIQLSYRRVKMVGATGFEPTTPWSQARCSTKLSYAPTTQEILCHISQLLSRIFSSFSKARLSSFLHNICNYTSTQKQMQAFFNTATKNFYPAKDSSSACISISLP